MAGFIVFEDSSSSSSNSTTAGSTQRHRHSTPLDPSFDPYAEAGYDSDYDHDTDEEDEEDELLTTHEPYPVKAEYPLEAEPVCHPPSWVAAETSYPPTEVEIPESLEEFEGPTDTICVYVAFFKPGDCDHNCDYSVVPKHWSLYIDGPTCETQIVIEVTGSVEELDIWLEIYNADIAESGALAQTNYLCGIDEGDIETIMDVARRLHVRTDVPSLEWVSQGFVFDVLDGLEGVGVVDREDSGYSGRKRELFFLQDGIEFL